MDIHELGIDVLHIDTVRDDATVVDHELDAAHQAWREARLATTVTVERLLWQGQLSRTTLDTESVARATRVIELLLDNERRTYERFRHEITGGC